MTELLDTTQAARMLGIARQTLAIMRLKGTSPEYVKLGSGNRGRVFYERATIEAFIAARIRRSTSDTRTATSTSAGCDAAA